MGPLSLLWADYKWVAFLLALVGAYAYGRHDGAALVEGEQAREERLVQEAVNKSLDSVSSALSKLEVKNVTIRRAVEREVREKPVYVDCRHDADGLRLLNTALENRPVPAGDRQLPADPGPAAR